MIKALLSIAIVIAILFAVCGAMALIDFIRPKTGMWLRILVALVISVAVGWLCIGAASAHDHSRPALDSWYPTLRSPAGSNCCDGPSVDAVHLADVDWESRAGRYRVRIDGEWIDVPPGAVLDVPNRDGRTLVWPGWLDGKRTVRCFMPGAMT